MKGIIVLNLCDERCVCTWRTFEVGRPLRSSSASKNG